MVFTTKILLFAKVWKPKRRSLRGKLVDTLKLQCVGGSGGTGLPKYGGVGGQGGCVYCIGTEKESLNQIIKTYHGTVKAGHGEDSLKKKIVGEPGKDVTLKVPLGITIFTEQRKIGEIDKEGDTCILARGGPGGNKDNHFIGREGQTNLITLDLKLIADVGFVGFPNAGKSTLLKALSRAQPKIASYPFTTITPNLGTIKYPDQRSISLADLPGLIEGAHRNIGMGHNFLKHVERTKLLMLVADVQGFQLSPRHILRSCFETVLLLNKELELYDPILLEKPSLLLINKMDTQESAKLFDETKDKLINYKDFVNEIPLEMQSKKLLKFDTIMGISALKSGDDIKEVATTIRTLLDINEELNEIDDTIEDIEDKIREKGPTLT